MDQKRLGITVEESTAIKGLLIILIILGHAQPLIQIPGVLRRFFYDFHVHCFMILPLLYPVKYLSSERIKNYFARLMVPFILLFLLFFLGKNIPLFISSYHSGVITFKDVINTINGGLHSLIMGGYFPLAESIKLRYLWFLPLMFSFSIIKDFYNTTANQWTKATFISLGMIFYMILWVCLYLPYFAGIKETMMDWSPFSIYQALGALFLGVTTVTLLKKTYFSNQRKIIQVVLSVVFIVIFLIYSITPKASPYMLVLKSMIPVIAFMLFYNYKEILARLSILRKFGEHSFEIYIVQSPLCIAMYTIIPNLFPTESFLVRACVFIFILAICYYIAKLLLKISIVKRILFPRTWDEFVGKTDK